MFKRWWDRRVGSRAPEAETDEPDGEEWGTLVTKGKLVTLRTHVASNRDAFQRWYGDPEIAELLRHDLEPLTPAQSRSYFDSFIMPASARGICFAIHERRSKRLIGTTALTDRTRIKGQDGESALFRIVIGEKETWGQGYGTEATRLVARYAFETLGLSEIRLEVFAYNQRAIAAYTRVGFEISGEHVEWVARRKTELRVREMRLNRGPFMALLEQEEPADEELSEKQRELRTRRQQLRQEKRAERRSTRATSRRKTARQAEETEESEAQDPSPPD